MDLNPNDAPEDDGLKSVQMFAHQLFGSDATVVDSCIMILTTSLQTQRRAAAHSAGPISDRHGRPSLGKLLDFDCSALISAPDYK